MASDGQEVVAHANRCLRLLIQRCTLLVAAFLLIDVSRRTDPAAHVSLFILLGHKTSQMPPIAAVFAFEPIFHLARLSRPNRLLPGSLDRDAIVGMNGAKAS